MNRRVSIDEVRAWLLARSPNVHDIDLDLDLIDTRVLDSLAFIDFIAFLENLLGRDIDVTTLTAASLRTLRSIERTLLVPRERE